MSAGASERRDLMGPTDVVAQLGMSHATEALDDAQLAAERMREMADFIDLLAGGALPAPETLRALAESWRKFAESLEQVNIERYSQVWGHVYTTSAQLESRPNNGGGQGADHRRVNFTVKREGDQQ